jgi:hypothetical protein
MPILFNVRNRLHIEPGPAGQRSRANAQRLSDSV